MAHDHEEDSRPRKRNHLHVARPIYTENDFQKGYTHHDKDVTAVDKLRRKVDKIEVTPKSFWQFLLRLIPILKWLPTYNLRNDIIGDSISGVTTAIMRVPQEMGYAILATLPAVHGLYIAFFSVLVYAVLGTSRHISIGTWAVISIMAGDAIESIVNEESNTEVPTVAPTDDGTNDDTELRIQVAISLCLLVGIIQIGMSILRLGIVTIYLSEPLVKGFTTGAAVHVFTSQFPKLFGVSVDRYSGPFALVYTYIEFFTEISTVNTCAILTSILSLLILVVIGEINDRQAAKGWCRKEGVKGKKLPLPSELLVVIIATLVSSYGGFEEKYDLDVVGYIPTGLPRPIIPPTKYLSSLIGSAFAMAIVGFAISISLAQLFARKHNYQVDANQELLAYGSIHLVGSFFQCFPNATSMSRTAVQEGAGGKTQLAGIISAVVVLAILLWLGPLFEQLPQCVLGCIIVIALRGMLRQVSDLPMLWAVSLIDFLLWIVTFTLVVFLGVDLGLLLGVIFALITVVVRSQSPYCALLGRVPNTEIYRDISFVQDVNEVPGISIFRCSSSLSFINADHFRESLFKKVGVNPQMILIEREEEKSHQRKSADTNGNLVENMEINKTGGKSNKHTAKYEIPESSAPVLHTVIIECSMFNHVDVVGVKTLQAIVTDYDKVDVRVIFANCTESVRKSLLNSSTIHKSSVGISLDRMYVSLHDAVLSSMVGTRSASNTFIEQSACSGAHNMIVKADVDSKLAGIIDNTEQDGVEEEGNINKSFEADVHIASQNEINDESIANTKL